MEEKSTASNSDPRWSVGTLVKIASQYNSVLDLGCGTGRVLKQIHADKRLGIDACLKAIVEAGRNNNGAKFLCCDLMDPACSEHHHIEFVYGIDIVEHFEKETAFEFIKRFEAVATKRIVWFIPVGNHPQTKDDRGFGNNYYQTHRSTWYPEDMEALGYTVWHYPNWHKNIKPPKEKGAMWCQKILA